MSGVKRLQYRLFGWHRHRREASPKFAECMRDNGVSHPAQTVTSAGGAGPVSCVR
jgi:hypothetical protein